MIQQYTEVYYYSGKLPSQVIILPSLWLLPAVQIRMTDIQYSNTTDSCTYYVLVVHTWYVWFGADRNRRTGAAVFDDNIDYNKFRATTTAAVTVKVFSVCFLSTLSTGIIIILVIMCLIGCCSRTSRVNSHHEWSEEISPTSVGVLSSS